MKVLVEIETKGDDAEALSTIHAVLDNGIFQECINTYPSKVRVKSIVARQAPSEPAPGGLSPRLEIASRFLAGCAADPEWHPSSLGEAAQLCLRHADALLDADRANPPQTIEKAQPTEVTITLEQAQKLAAWADAETTGFGKYFTDAMGVAQEVRDALEWVKP